MKRKIFSCLLLMFCLATMGYAQLNIGNQTHLKVFKSKIYVAGSTGIACLESPTEVEWQLALPAADTRLMEVDDNGVVFVTYDYDGIEKKGGF